MQVQIRSEILVADQGNFDLVLARSYQHRTPHSTEFVRVPYEFPVDGKPVVRRDYMKQMGRVGMHQSTLAMLSKGYVLSFTFIGSSDEEVQERIEWLKIGTPAKSPRSPAKSAKP